MYPPPFWLKSNPKVSIMPYFQCGCRRTIKYHNARSLSSALSRCRASHIEPGDLNLHDGPPTVANTIVHIMGHSSSPKLALNLGKRLLALGFSEDSVVVDWGYTFNRDKFNGRLIRYNEICHQGWLHRWLPSVVHHISTRRTAHRRTACVWFLEADADWGDLTLQDFCEMANAIPKSADVGWPGYRRLWQGSLYQRAHGTQFQLEGSHAVIFRRRGLEQAYDAAMKSPRWCHWDLLLSRALKHIHIPQEPSIGTRGHYSIIFGKGRRTWRDAFHASHSIKKFRKGRCTRSSTSLPLAASKK